MMLPLCTSVTLGLSLSIAYWIALRTRRSVPSRDTGLMPMPEVSGKRIFLTPISSVRNSISFLRLVALGLVLDAGVDVFRVLAEDHHVGLLGLLHRRRHALEVLDRAQADVEVEFLAQRHVERADAAADRRGQRALDRDHVVAQRPRASLPAARRRGRRPWSTSRRRRSPSSGSSLAAVGLGHRRVDHLDHHRRDVDAGAVALDVRDDRLVGHVEREVGVDGDLLAAGRAP